LPFGLISTRVPQAWVNSSAAAFRKIVGKVEAQNIGRTLSLFVCFIQLAHELVVDAADQHTGIGGDRLRPVRGR